MMCELSIFGSSEVVEVSWSYFLKVANLPTRLVDQHNLGTQVQGLHYNSTGNGS